MNSSDQSKLNLLIIPIALAGLGAVILFILKYDFLSWDFRNNLWGPAYLLVNGQDPFRVYLLFPGTNALWSPAGIGFFFYLGYLPLTIATNLWLLINIFILIGVTFAYWWQKKAGVLPIVISLLLVVLSPVTISHLFFGQSTLWFVICSLGAAYLLQKERLGLAGAVFAIGLLKPQLALLVLPGLLVGVWQVANLRGLLRFVTGLSLTMLVCLVPIWIGYPGWLDGYLNAFLINPQWIQPTSFRILQMVLSTWGVVIWVVMFLAALGLVVYVWQHSDPLDAMANTLALTTLVSPYLWSYDFVMLIPFFLMTLVRLRSRLYAWLFGFIWLLTSIGGLLVRLRTDNVDLRFVWIPWVIVIAGSFLSWWDKKSNWNFDRNNISLLG